MYESVTVLLGEVATAVLQAYGTTEESYAGDLTAAVLYAPLRDGLTIALPYAALAADVPPWAGAENHARSGRSRRQEPNSRASSEAS